MTPEQLEEIVTDIEASYATFQAATDVEETDRLRRAYTASLLINAPALTAALRQAWEENERLRVALEWALDNADTDHPHYPYRDDDKWTYPYLVSGTPLGGGVGNAYFDTAADAVRAALKEPTHD